MEILGIDVGGTGIKSNIVDLKSGNVVNNRFKVKTPIPATPDAVMASLKESIDNFNWKGQQIGIGFPAVIQNGICRTASNIDKAFINFPIDAAFSETLGCEVTVINDADAAGIAEMTFGKGKGVNGTVVFITLGTGIGSAIFHNGVLIPNTEMGHLLYKKSIFEKYASNAARERRKLSWKQWAKDLNVYLNHLNLILTPDLILIGGGISKNFDLYGQYLDVPVRLETASLLNDAGIIGAAMATQKNYIL
ncbi:MAG: ROK family protein [Saprospiraceae bacterium]|nr:MAG: polyphosphate--glucose phosphotransferase [Bacteroidetes bacterium OLB9]MCO6463110.1 ROK family protein [Saprospiraceae bacterium]